MNAPLRAPTEDGGVLVEPPFDQVGLLLEENRRRLLADIPLLGRPLRTLQALARQEILEQARAYLTEAGEPLPDFSSSSLLLAGHQPELFHSGVWVKNFALHGLARRHGVTPVNLVVDNDIVKSTTLQAPVLGNKTHLAKTAFDVWRDEIPFEERRVFDESYFDHFPDRAREITATWPWQPLLADFWKEVRNQAKRTANLGERFAGARRALERRWGCANLEVPVSRLCRTEAFAWFAFHLLENLGEFHTMYNETVADYRRRHGIANKQHPVPNLGREGDWLEAPLWVWRTDRPRRERVFVRKTEKTLELRAGQAVLPILPRRSAAGWRELEKQGFKVRCRALTTTLFARVILGDIFMHGIGGAKYDELTDVLIQRFFGIAPPAFLVVSATLLLPFQRFPRIETQCRDLARQRRDVWWNPQRHLAEGNVDDQARQLAGEKQAWIKQTGGNATERRRRFAKLREFNALLQPFLKGRQEALSEQGARCEQDRETNRILSRRDLAFCWYPEDQLRSFFQRFLQER